MQLDQTEYMNDNSTLNPRMDDNTDDNIDLREIVEKYLRFWKIFAICIFFGIVFAYLYMNFQRRAYVATSVIKIKNENTGDASSLSAFKDLGIIAPSNQRVEDEIEILKSKDLISEVVKELKLNIKFYTNKNSISKFLDDKLSMSTEFYENERYSDPPLDINFLFNDSILYKTSAAFIINVKSPNNFIYSDIEKSYFKKYAFGEKFLTDFGEIIITPSNDFKQKDILNSDILVIINSVGNVANSYAQRIVIEPKSDFSSILNLKITDPVREKAEDFLTEVVNKYNDRAIRLKKELTESTSDFVTQRLRIISEELSDVDLSAESIKTRYRLSDAASNAGLNMQSGQDIENQIVRANMQLEQITSVKDYVSSKNPNELIPSDVGVADGNVSSSVQRYNELMLQKKRFLKNSTEKNPIVVNLTEQLNTLESNIKQGLENLESSQKISIEALNRQDVRINSRLYAAPRQERQYRVIQRQQQIKEQLYLYLLQKREETAITLGVADPNAKIIDGAKGLPKSSKKIITYLGFMIMSILIPFIILYLLDLLDTKIHTRDDVESALKIPIIADIPRLPTKQQYLVKKDDYSSVAEAFRILRTNLNFVLPDAVNHKKGKVIFITSTIAHEGKSFISSNLSNVLSHTGARTLIIGLDIRAPRIKNYLGIRGKIGITNYIVNTEVSPQDIIIKAPNNENLDVISSGDLAPNPAELLMSPRLTELFDFARNEYDYIIVDTAAFSMVTDTLLLSRFADAFIYVIRANFLDKRMLKYIKSIYQEKRLPNMTLLVNGIDPKKEGYGYGYGYGTKHEKAKAKLWWK